VLSGETTNTNFKVFGFTGSGLKPMNYHTRGGHTNHYTTNAVQYKLERIYRLDEKVVGKWRKYFQLKAAFYTSTVSIILYPCCCSYNDFFFFINFWFLFI
jgi:hypothetical protein